MNERSLPADYADRVYAGVLGKVIGVYLGRPFENWRYERIQERLGDIEYYVHDRLGVPLLVTDDDISGTFTFVRALEDHGFPEELSSRQVGETWLNYLVKERTILWWGGLGNSTEHTAYLRLASGVAAPASGSMARNGQVVAEQIGAQIFIDGWAMVAPGDPDRAVRLADAAARVSHDGEAVYGARMVAAMESLAFVERDTGTLIDAALGYIPPDSVIATMIGDLRRWRADGADWRASRAKLDERYGYDSYGGNCHMVPNHGLIILALLHGEDDFSKTLQIVNSCGWDTDCNSGNVGCLMGIKEGLTGIDRGLGIDLDWRGPVADRLYLPTADGGRAISDCVTEAMQVINIGRRLAGDAALAPDDGAQFHFSFPGSVQGFQVQDGDAGIRNVALPTGGRALRIDSGSEARVGSPVFIPSKETADYFEGRVYPLLASPRIFPGQRVEATLSTQTTGVQANLYLCYYGEDDEPTTFDDDTVELKAGQRTRLSFTVPPLAGPIFLAGVRLLGPAQAVCLEAVKWSGAPTFRLERPSHQGAMWRRAWVNGVDRFARSSEMFRLIQNQGLGMLMQGTREWRDYTLTAAVTPHLVNRAGIAARVQGLTRFYGLFLAPGNRVQLVRMQHSETVLAEAPFEWHLGETHELTLRVHGHHLVGSVNGTVRLESKDDALDCGAAGLVVEEGRLAIDWVEVSGVD